MTPINEGVDPPDKNDNVTGNVTETHFIDLNTKNSRPRDSDDDASEYETDEKKPKTTIENIQRKISHTLLRKSLLDTNPYFLLDTDEATDDLAGKESKNINVNQFNKINHSGKNMPKQRIPPITITKMFKNPKEAISNIQLMFKGKVNFKILREGYSVKVESLDDHSSMKKFLAQQHIPFYTYTTLDKKPLRLVLKGVHHTYTPDDIIEDLSTKKVKVLSVQPMFAKGKVSMDMFIVNFVQGTKIAELMKTIKYVCHQRISWHSFIKKDIGTQCRKCQRFGHAASNCGLEYRCVKCPHRHAPGDCPLENDEPATCVNCSSNHPASYKKCPAYTKYTESLKQFKEKSGKTNFKRSNNVISSSVSSRIQSNLSYSQALTSSQPNNSKNDLHFLSSEIENLFNCSLTHLLEKIQAFIPDYKKANDPMLKKIMIIDLLSQFT
jgi:hypothetical protein